jgi:UPF0716 protein FxsA
MIFLQAGGVLILAEILAFIAMGSLIGFFPAVSLCLLSAVTGFLIVQHQGLEALRQMQAALDKGLVPMDEMFDGICILAAGTLLIMPGFVSDLIGFALLIPAVRKKLRIVIARRFGKQDGSFNPDTGVIEGDFIRVREEIDLLRPPPQA